MTRKTRRALLRGGVAATIAGLAGCSTSDSQSTSTPQSGASASTDAETASQSTATAEATDRPTQTEESTPISSKPVSPSLHAASGTTGFDVDLAGNPIVGSPDAALDLYYWSDYLCPFCKKFEERTFPKLVRTHVAEGRIRVVLLQFPNIGENSMTASVMSRCVWRQVREDSPDTFWNWHSTVFDEQGFTQGDWSNRSNLLELTESVEGVDASAVDSCLSENRETLVSAVEAERQRGKRAGLDGTPSFVLYDPDSDTAADLQGAQPYSRFDSKIRSLTE
ncbi:DsbA family protein [Haloarcula limicola]|uniref:DsbA family protein n=1 Tax=Haloarcula limicola TaxID=1429915 RepID=UPI0013918EAD|nr:thioredoxin domain-containing protein [Halomicroarcula limicola]